MAENITTTFLKKNNIYNNRFYGYFTQHEGGAFLFENVISIDEGNLIIDEKGNRIIVWLGLKNDNFEVGNYYEFSIFLRPDKPLPSVDLVRNPPIKLDKNPFRSIVVDRYERLDRPESNKIIANLLREIGKGMYSSKERMIFELLQNADDSPAGEELKFHLDAHNGYLLIMHNGLPFNRDDVSAITSAAQSTKKNDKKKTGYKGIGFKSVFTDSQKVIIKSGGFLFYFDRNNNSYKNFDSFYFDREDFRLSPILIKKYEEKWKHDKKSFNGLLDIPWQLLPIWGYELPADLKDSRLSKYNNNVGIAIEVGSDLIMKYLDAIELISENPVFLLFLRHINIFKSFKNGITIRKEGLNPTKITKTKRDFVSYERSYLKKEWLGIPVNDSEFENEGIKIFKNKEVNDYGEESFYFSRDKDGKIKIENIPPKISAAESTSISFAAPILEKKLRCEPEYLRGQQLNSFFTYLPLTENRIHFPFLVNADFVLSSNREGIQGDNEWNEFLFSKIGTLYLDWIKEVAELGLEQNTIHPEYLSLLLKAPLPSHKDVQPLIEIFNRNYLDKLSTIDFIVDFESNLRKCSEIILDKTEISHILGTDFFYEFTLENKYLPTEGLNISYLNYEYLEISKFTFEDIIECLETPENLSLLKSYYQKATKNQKQAYQQWVNKNVSKLNEYLTQIFFIEIDDVIYDLREALEKQDIFVVTHDSLPISLLPKVGFKVAILEADSIPNIIHLLSEADNYLNSDKGKFIYKKIIDCANFTLLQPREKYTLFNFIKSLKGVGPDIYINELKLFSSDSQLSTLTELVSSEISYLPTWLKEFVILSEEESLFDKVTQAYLINENDIFEKIICNENHLKTIQSRIDKTIVHEYYKHISKMFGALPENHGIKYKDLSWLYSESEEVFKKSDYFYSPAALNKASKNKYEAFKNFIESKTELKVLTFEANELRKQLSLGIKESDFSNEIKTGITLSQQEAIIMLDLLVENKETDFFEKYCIESTETNFDINLCGNFLNYYTKDEKLVEYIAEKGNNYVLLDSNIYNSNLKDTGLLENENLISQIIDQGVSDNTFVQFVYSYKNNTELCKKYLKTIKNIQIETDGVYDKNSDEFKIFELIKHLEDEELVNFRDKIYIDGESLNKMALSNDIWFKIKGKNKKLNIQLSDILIEYKNKTYSKDTLKNKFRLPSDEDHKQKINTLFDSKNLSIEEIKGKLLALNPEFFNAKQLLFCHFYFLETDKDDFLYDLTTFLDNYETDKPTYEKEAQEFLNLCLSEGDTNPFEVFVFNDFNPQNKIWNNEYSIESEQVPDWVINWVGNNAEKLLSLFSFGLNNDDSHVVMFRKGLLEKDISLQDTHRSSLSSFHLNNSLTWIGENLKLTENDVETLKPIYTLLQEKKVRVKKTQIPTLHKKEVRLKPWSESDIYHYKNESWGIYAEKIEDAIHENDEFLINDILPPTYRAELNTVTESFEEVEDLEKLNGGTSEFDKTFYNSLKSNPNAKVLKIYAGDGFPYKILYRDILEIEILKDLPYLVLDTAEIVVCKSQEDQIPESLKQLLDKDYYTDLLSKKYKHNDEDNPDKNEEDNKFDPKNKEYKFSEREEEALNQLFDNQPPEEFYKNWNLASLIKAIVYLPQYGYNVETAKKNLVSSHEYAQLQPVYLGDDDTEYTIMGRSAANGLLYLTTQAWERLKKSNVQLFVNFGGSKSTIFTNQQEILDYSMQSSDFQIMRIMTEPTAENINEVLTGKFDKKKVWLVFKMKNDERIDYLFNSWQPNDKYGDIDETKVRDSNENDL